MRHPEDKNQNKVHYYPIASTMATHAVSALGAPLSKNPQVLRYGGKKVEVRTVSDTITRLELSTKKLFDFLMLLLTRFNKNNGDWSRNAVYFQLHEFMEVMGYRDTRQMRNKCFNKLAEDLDKLRNVYLREDDSAWFGLVECYRFIDKRNIERTKKDIVADNAWFEVVFHPGFMDHLRRDKFIAPFLIDLFQRVRKNDNAYALAKRMVLHYSISNKRNTRNRQRLKVKTLLECCPNATSQRAGGVRQSFEKAMDSLQTPPDGDDGMIDWRYLVNGKQRTPEEFSNMRLPQKAWLNLVVEFCPLDLFSKMSYSRCPPLVASFALFSPDEDENVP